MNLKGILNHLHLPHHSNETSNKTGEDPNDAGINPGAPGRNQRRNSEDITNISNDFGPSSNQERRRSSTIDSSQIPHAAPPTKGYAAQVTGGTGTTAMALGDDIPRGPHLTGFGNLLDPAVPSLESTMMYDTHNLNDGVNITPESGYAAQVTGGTGTTTLLRAHKDKHGHEDGE